ncbi:arginine/serine-rich protein 1 isoform X2 [Hemicordylus capensis]|uniref:arginine/serine-rich protein 1 isoform X2 n=2 Tax=Hemicordylus capensis TaxID=884348 RepID=UPI002302E231|nr:arginine/serine-rich protein 1 isoform X2 [Hemicordylus capensis]
MAVTNDTELPLSPDPSACYQIPQQAHGSPEQNGSTSTLGVMETGQQKTEDTGSRNSEKQGSNKKTEEMTNFMDDLTLSSPQARSRSTSRSSCSRKYSSRSSSRSSYSSRSSSSTSASSASCSRSRSRSRSHAKRNCSRRYRRYSRSYSRSRSRSRSYRYRERYHLRYHRKYYCSPPRYRSRSRSPGRSYYRRSYSTNKSRNQRYYGFGRTIYPEAYRSWRSRSRSRSRSRTPLRLTEKEKRELLEIAKANAAKTFGADKIVLPASLRMCTSSKENEDGKPKKESVDSEQSIKSTEDAKNGTERASTIRGLAFSPNNTMARLWSL